MVHSSEIAARYMQLVDGFVPTQLLYVAASEFRRLLDAAGFTVQRVVRTGSSAGLGILEAVAL